MRRPKFTSEELAARQRERGEVNIDTVRDFMCFEQPSLTPQEAAFALWNRYPDYSYETFLHSTRLVQQVKQIGSKQEAKKQRPD